MTMPIVYGDALPNFESGAYMDQNMQYQRDAQLPDGRIRGIINEQDRPFFMWKANNPLTIWEAYRMLGDKKNIPAVGATTLGKEFVNEGAKSAENAEGVSYFGTETSDAVGHYVIYEVGSGVYDFTVSKMPEVAFPEPMNDGPNLAGIARISASSMHILSEKEPGFEAFKSNDGNPATSWRANASEDQWLEVAWAKPRTFHAVRIDEAGEKITSYEVQAWMDGSWKTVAAGKTCGVGKTHTFGPVTSAGCRLLFTGANGAPEISEFVIRNRLPDDS
jgi:hypothetical protein